MTDADREEIKKSALEADTSNWKTISGSYKSTNYQVKLPSDFQEKSVQADSEWHSKSFENDAYNFYIHVEPIARMSSFPGSPVSLAQIADALKNGNTYGAVIAQKEIKVAGVHALLQDGYSLADPGGFVNLSTILLSRDNFIVLTLSSKQNDWAKVKDGDFVRGRLTQDFRGLNNQILSTFKFTEPKTEADISDWKMYTNSQYGFSFQYPSNATLSTGTNGTILILPIQSGTNLSQKTATIIAQNGQCPEVNSAIPPKNTTLMKNGIDFSVSVGGDAGMSQYYETTQYTTVKNNSCVGISFLLHSGNIGAYEVPPKSFNKASESTVFSQMISTFKFTNNFKVESAEEVKVKIDFIYKNLYIGEIFKSGSAYLEPFNVDREAYSVEQPIEIKNYPKVIKVYPVVKNANIFYNAVFNAKFYGYVPDAEENSFYFYQGFSKSYQPGLQYSGLQYKLNTFPNDVALVIALFNQEIKSVDFSVKDSKRPYSQIEYDDAVDRVKKDSTRSEGTLANIDLDDTIVGAKLLALYGLEGTDIKLLLSQYRTHGFEYAADVYVIDFIKDGKVIQTYQKYNWDGPY